MTRIVFILLLSTMLAAMVQSAQAKGKGILKAEAHKKPSMDSSESSNGLSRIVQRIVPNRPKDSSETSGRFAAHVQAFLHATKYDTKNTYKFSIEK